MNVHNIDKPTTIKKKKKKGFCGNCGKYGHTYSKCREPITSLGIINFKLNFYTHKTTNFVNLFYDEFGEHIIDEYGNKNIITPLSNNIKCPVHNAKMQSMYLRKFCFYQNSIKFLMIRRKNTLGYIEFIRGHYEPTDADSIVYLFQQMVKQEINMIEKYDIDILWNNLWSSGNDSKTYECEFKQSKEKFNKLKNGSLSYDLYFYTKNVDPEYDSPEWGFPKGRRNYHEKNLNCAIREFNEETNYKTHDYKIMKRLHSLNEVFLGTNGIRYKHIYYISIASTDKDAVIDDTNPKQYEEIGDIGWFTYDEAINLIRPHHKQRKKILSQLYMFLINKIIEFEINENKTSDKEKEKEEDKINILST